MFNDEKRKSASFIFEKMKKIYPTFQTPDEITVGEWIGVLEGYSQTEILDAFKNYRKNVAYNQAPTPGDFKKFLAMVTENKNIAEVATHELKLIAPAEQLMQRDIAAKCCRHLLPVYKRAVDYVLGEMLLKEVPASEWRKMSVATRYRQAMDKGLFGRFSEVLVFICRRDYGKDYQFESEAMLDADRRRNEFNLSDAAEHLAKAWWHN